MKPRNILRLLALLFLLVGYFILRNANIDPAPRTTWETYPGKLHRIDIADTNKAGRRAIFTIEGDSGEPEFTLSHIRKFPGLEEKLLALPAGSDVSIEAVPRELAGEFAPEGQPLTLLVLKSAEKTIYDRDRDQQDPLWISIAVYLAGGLALTVGTVILVLTFLLKAKR